MPGPWDALLEERADATLSVDDGGVVRAANAAAERLFGLPRTALVGRDLEDMIPGHRRLVLADDTGSDGRGMLGRRADGTLVPLRVAVARGAPISDAGAPLLLVLRDATVERALEEALRARDEEYAAVTAAMVEGIVVQDADGVIVNSNAAAERILGLTADQLAGRTSMDPRWRAIAADGSPLPGEDHPGMVTLRTGEAIRRFVMGVDRPDGSRTWIEITTAPIRLRGHERPGVLAVFDDVTERRIADLALRDRESGYRELLDRSTDMIVRLAADSRVVFVSQAVETLLGYEPDALVGRQLADLAHPGDLADADVPDAINAAGGGVVRFEVRLLRADGAYEWVEATARALLDPDGRPIGRIASLRSVQARREAEEQARELEARYRTLARSLPGGAVLLFDADLRYLLVEGTAIPDGGAHLVGRRVEEVLSPPVAEAVTPLYRAALSGETVRARLRWADGRVFDVTAAPVGLVAGGRHCAMALALDVTDSTRLEEQHVAYGEIAVAALGGMPMGELLEVVARRVTDLFAAVGGVVVKFNGDASIVACAPAAFRDLLGDRLRLTDESAVGVVARTGAGAVIVYPAHADPASPSGPVAASGAVGSVAAPIRIGARVWGAIGLGLAHRDRLGDETLSRLTAFADVIAASIANAETLELLEHRAATDALTGLPNRWSFEARLEEEVGRARRHGQNLALAMLDLDHFKEINDAYGHPVGDAVLQVVASTLRGHMRDGDQVSRVGGEEFAWLLPHEGIAGARAAAERLRRSLSEASDAGLPPVTVSVGIAELAPSGGADTLVRDADDALYRAKQAGRDRVEVADEPHALDGSVLEMRARLDAVAGLRALARVIDARQAASRDHSREVAELARRIAVELGWSARRAGLLRDAALVHDVGMVAVPDALLRKAGPLDAAERAQIERHAALGAEVAAAILDADQVAWIRGHHERYDGTGYPDRLAGEQIPHGARILALADAYDAITGPRSYRPARPPDAALAECRRVAGTQFDPATVAALAAVLRRDAR